MPTCAAGLGGESLRDPFDRKACPPRVCLPTNCGSICILALICTSYHKHVELARILADHPVNGPDIPSPDVRLDSVARISQSWAFRRHSNRSRSLKAAPAAFVRQVLTFKYSGVKFDAHLPRPSPHLGTYILIRIDDPHDGREVLRRLSELLRQRRLSLKGVCQDVWE